jgi:hypothetical protein
VFSKVETAYCSCGGLVVVVVWMMPVLCLTTLVPQTHLPAKFSIMSKTNMQIWDFTIVRSCKERHEQTKPKLANRRKKTWNALTHKHTNVQSHTRANACIREHVRTCSQAATGNDRALMALLSRGAALDVTSVGGATPLHGAAAEGHVAMVASLLHLGVTVDTADRSESTPLSLAGVADFVVCSQG